MKKIDNMLLVAVVVALGMGNLAGLGNAACSVNSIYWVPFIIDAGIFILTGIREWKRFDEVRKAEKKA